MALVVASFLFYPKALASEKETMMYYPGFGTSPAVQEGVEKAIQEPFVIVPRQIRQSLTGNEAAHHAVRLSIMKQLLHSKLVSFVKNPYPSRLANYGLTQRNNVLIGTTITSKDDLDLLIDNTLEKIWNTEQNLVLSKQDIKNLGPIYLWQSAQDLHDLGYKIVSSRYRINYDPAYRRHNIVTAFWFLGHIKVLNPGETFGFLASVNYDPRAQKNYKNWLAIVNDDEIPVYGWGLCGWSTALYQGLLTNKGLTLKGRNHSKRFTNLYTATINGQKITTPGLDATVFAGSTDLYVTNTSDHPIIIAMNFNGMNGWIEEIFSVGLTEDKGSLEYVGKTKSKCYTRNINEKKKTSCYKEVH